MTRYSPLLLLFLIVVITYLVYSPGLSGTFMFDDLPNIQSNNKLQIESLGYKELIEAAFSSESGPLKRPVSMVSFALNFYFTGFDPFFFKLTNIIIHLVNGILIYFLTTLILQAYLTSYNKPESTVNISLMALAVASAWLLHPINLTSVLYIVQRMSSLATLFTLLGMISYLAGRLHLHEEKKWLWLMLLGPVLFGVLAILSKENGLLLYGYIFLVEVVLFRFGILKYLNKKQVKNSIYIIGFIAVIFIIVLFNYLPEYILAGYQARSFTLGERLLTEARVIWLYLYMIVKPNLNIFSLHHDNIIISTDLFTPLTTIFSIVGIIALLLLSFLFRQKSPLMLFGVLFFLVGLSMESSVIALEIAYEHRNYLPCYGILLLVIYCLFSSDIFNKLGKFRQVTALLFIVLLAFNTTLRAQQWSNPVDLIFNELNQNPESPRVNYSAGRFYAIALDTDLELDREKYYSLAEYYFKRSYELDTNQNAALISLLLLSSSNGKVPEDKWIKALTNNLENNVIDSTSVVALDALMTCKMTGECNIDGDVINELIYAVKGNEKIKRNDKAVFFNSACRYLLVEDDNIEEAAKFGQLAIESDSGMEKSNRCLEQIKNIYKPAQEFTE